ADPGAREGGRVRCRAVEGEYGGCFGDAPAARLRHRGWPRRIAASDPLYHADHLYLLRPTADLDVPEKDPSGRATRGRARRISGGHSVRAARHWAHTRRSERDAMTGCMQIARLHAFADWSEVLRLGFHRNRRLAADDPDSSPRVAAFAHALQGLALLWQIFRGHGIPKSLFL